MQITRQIVFDIDKSIYTTIDAKAGDVNSRFIEFTLVNNSLPIDLTGHTVKIFAIKTDNTLIFNNTIITNTTEGKVLVELTSQALAVSGTLRCELVIYGANNSVLSTKTFTISVIASIRNDSAVESTNEFTALTEALSTVTGINNKADKMYVDEEVNSVKTELANKANIIEVENSINIINTQLADNVSLINNLDINKASKAEVEAVTNQIANIVAHNGDGTKDTEIIDLRTGFNGVIYASAKQRADIEMATINGTILPTNLNKNEGTTSPTFLPSTIESASSPGISLVIDTDSPMKTKLPYKRKIFRTTSTGSVNYIHLPYLPDLTSKPSKICFGFWAKDSDVNLLYDSTRLMEYWIYQGGKYVVFKFDVKTLITSELNTVPVNKSIPATGLIDSFDVEAKCLNKNSGYSYIRVTLSNIIWNSGITDFKTVNWYHIFTAIKTQLVGAELNLTNLTLLYNQDITNGFYVYSDGAGVVQYPPQEGLHDQITELKETVENISVQKTPITITLDSTKTEKDIAIRSAFNSTKDLVLFARTKPDGRNNVVNLYGGTLINKTDISAYTVGTNLQMSTDDACPVNFNSGYIGANHGYDRVRKLTLINHGKTYADISSEWLDGANKKWYIIKIIDLNNLWVLGENLATDEFYNCLSTLTGTTLTHSQGAVNISTMSGFTVTNDQMTPSVANHNVKILIDGVKEITQDGTYGANFVDISENYSIINPSSVVPYLIANKPVGGYTSNPSLNVGSVVANMSNVFRYLSDGTLLIINDFTNAIRINLGYFGIVQELIPSLNVLGGGLYKYIPKTLPMTVNSNNYDLRVPRDMSQAIDSLNFINTYWENPNSPPDRAIDLFKDGTGTNKIGFAMGYLPVGDGVNRSTKVTNAWNIHSSKKSYPHFVDDALGNPISADRAIQGIAYRKFYDISNPSQRTSLYTIPFNEKTYLYIDYHGAIDDYIELDKKFIGKTFTVIEKSSNVTVYGSMVTDKLRVKVNNANPMYGYVVLLLQ